jgi:hypothetical protein
MTPKTPPADAPTADKPDAPSEPRNVVVDVLKNCTRLGGAILAAGRSPLLLTATEAKTAETLGLVKIVGVASAQG